MRILVGVVPWLVGLGYRCRMEMIVCRISSGSSRSGRGSGISSGSHFRLRYEFLDGGGIPTCRCR